MSDLHTSTPPASMEAIQSTEIGPNEASRIRLAARHGTTPDVLRTLAQDPATTVRAAVALNPTFAVAVDETLVQDPDERVRSLLAKKMARLLPSLSGAEQSAAQAHVHAMLRSLADDAAIRVRAVIAEALNSADAAPHDIIIKLAHDRSMAVSNPIVRFSPLLTDADLLGLLATPPNPDTAVAVASRAGLSAQVADSIASHADSAALVALLSNRSATIQEATLDSLIGRAGEHPEWHEPLVSRPTLPPRSIRALALIVAGNLLDALINRADIPIELAAELRETVTQSLTGPQPLSDADILDRVRELHANSQLNEATLLDAAAAGDARLVAAVLVVASGVSPQMLERAVSLRSAKAVVSIVHSAQFSMRAATIVQSIIGRLGPSETLAPTGDHGYPLSAAEMIWQIELLNQPSR